MPSPRIHKGSRREGAPHSYYALMQRDDDTTDWVPGDVSSFDLKVFDADAGTPDTAVWSKAYPDPSPYLVTRVSGVGAAPSGYNFKLQIGHDEADDSAVAFNAVTIGGHELAVEITFTSSLPDVDGVTEIWEVAIEPRRS